MWQTHPEPTRDELPEEHQQAIGKIDSDDPLPPLYGTYHLMRYVVGIELHGEMATLYQWSPDESRTDVCDTYVVDVMQVDELLKTLKVVAGEPFRGRIGWCSPQSLCTGNGTDNSDVSIDVWMVYKIPESGTYHTSHTHAVGRYGRQLLAFVQRDVLISYT